MLSLGYFTLALGQSWSFYTGLALIVLGTGFFSSMAPPTLRWLMGDRGSLRFELGR